MTDGCHDRYISLLIFLLYFKLIPVGSGLDNIKQLPVWREFVGAGRGRHMTKTLWENG